uniref:Neurofascin n=1 Tax=Poecilia latipinna TaxID=48699 RepID=A0A3B3TN02_9TELE
MLVKWGTILEWNGPHLKYLVWWRRRDSREEWKNATTKWLKYYIYDADTFTPYELKVQAVNDFGLGPESPVVIGYSGEDRKYCLHLQCSLSILFLLNFKVYYWRDSSQLRWHRVNRAMRSKVFPNSDPEPSGVVTDLIPYSNYVMYIVVTNSRYEGPPSNHIHFSTPEGELSKFCEVSHLSTVNASRGEELKVEEFPPNVTSFSIRRFDRYTRYRFSVAAHTRVGLGEWHTEESPHYTTEIYAQDQVDISTQGWFIGIMCAVALIVLILLIVCFIKRSRGGKYPGTKGGNSCPLKGMKRLNRSDSDDSLVEYGEGGEIQFNEDGSFIGQYTGTRRDVRDLDFGGNLELHSPMNTIYSLA